MVLATAVALSMGLSWSRTPVAEGVEPGFHAAGEWRGAWDERDGLNREVSRFEETAIDSWRREETCSGGLGVNAEGRESGLECGTDCGDVALAAHLGDETASGAQGTMDASENGLLAGDAGDPVEGCVREDGVELLTVGQGGCVVMLDMQIALASRGQHGGRGVYAGDDGSCSGELFGEGAVAAAQVQDLFAGLWVEKHDDFGGEVGDESTVGSVGFGVPGLAGLGSRGHGLIVRLSREMREEDKNLQKMDKRQRCKDSDG